MNLTFVRPELIIAILLIVGGVAWLIPSGWVLIGGGLGLVILTAIVTKR